MIFMSIKNRTPLPRHYNNIGFFFRPVATSPWPIITCVFITSLTISLLKWGSYVLGLYSPGLGFTLTILNVGIVYFIRNIHVGPGSVFTLKRAMGIILTMIICNVFISLLWVCVLLVFCTLNPCFYLKLLEILGLGTLFICNISNPDMIRLSKRSELISRGYISRSASFDKDRRLFSPLIPWLERSNIALYDVFTEWLRYRKKGDVLNQETAMFFWRQHRELIERGGNFTERYSFSVLEDAYLIQEGRRLLVGNTPINL
jgi:hypothetical protein